ncbi:MAG: hypothetical protein Q4E59_01030 [Bacteroidales bacterium]|nr:hypothetical protein [Bacteroidales bacterium]
MKKLFLYLMLFCLSLPMMAQQQLGDKRTHSIFAFSDFKDAKVLQPFGRYTTAKANILLKNSTLCFLQDDKTVMEAYVDNVLGVEFDTVTYMRLDDNQMGKVIAKKGYNYLLCVTTINMSKLYDEREGGDNLPFFEITDVGAFFEIDGQAFESNKGYPLTDKYYFSIQGTIIPANETQFKKYVRPEMKSAFKRLMNDKFWSWSDPASLAELFTYLPEE